MQRIHSLTLGLSSLLASRAADRGSCWAECQQSGYYCPEFCCQPTDGGNPSCWDEFGIYSFEKCCDSIELPLPEKLFIQMGSLSLQLYRGPSDHNSPKFNERTLEVALGLWFLRRCLGSSSSLVPLEIGNVMSNYWPKEEFIHVGHERYLPWRLADLGSNGQDATALSFRDERVLSISTVEHVGHDNEGASNINGFRSDGSLESIEDWVRSWDASPSLLMRIAREARSFLVTFPIGLNARLDDVVSNTAWLRNQSRIVRRVNAENLWEVDLDFPRNPAAFLKYHYDLRDAYLPSTIALMFHPSLPSLYARLYGAAPPLRPPLRPPRHPRFRFANAVCVVTNVPELLAL